MVMLGILRHVGEHEVTQLHGGLGARGSAGPCQVTFPPLASNSLPTMGNKKQSILVSSSSGKTPHLVSKNLSGFPSVVGPGAAPKAVRGVGSLGCCWVLVVGAVGVISMPGASSSTPRLSYRPAELHNGAVLLIMSFIFSRNIKKRPRFGRLAIEMLGGGQGSRGKSRDWEKQNKTENKSLHNCGGRLWDRCASRLAANGPLFLAQCVSCWVGPPASGGRGVSGTFQDFALNGKRK